MAATNNIIQNNVNVNPSGVLVASTGRFYTVFRNTDGGDSHITVAFSDDAGETWSEVFEITTDSETFIASAIDSEDVVHIAYERSNYVVSYRTFTGGAFGTEEDIFDGTANTDSVNAVDIAVDSDNIPHVVWSQDEPAGADEHIYYSERSSGSWAARTQLSATLNTNDARIAIDSNDFIYVLWRREGVGSDIIRYNKNTGAWLGEASLATVGSTADHLSVVIDSSDNVHVTYQDPGGGESIGYLKYTESTDTWSTETDIESTNFDDQPTLGIDSNDKLYVAFRTSGSDMHIISSTDGGTTWTSSTEIIDLANGVSQSVFNTPLYPIVEGVNTARTSAGYQFIYEESSGVVRLHRSDGITLQTPVDENYSREANAALPSTDSVLGTLFTTTGYSNVTDDDNVYEDQAATDQYAIFLFKNRGEFNTDDIEVSWRGKTNIAPSTSTVFLQIYDHNLATWETLDSDAATAADTEFELTGAKTSSQSDYYDDNLWVTCRVYQLAQ